MACNVFGNDAWPLTVVVLICEHREHDATDKRGDLLDGGIGDVTRLESLDRISSHSELGLLAKENGLLLEVLRKLEGTNELVFGICEEHQQACVWLLEELNDHESTKGQCASVWERATTISGKSKTRKGDREDKRRKENKTRQDKKTGILAFLHIDHLLPFV